MRHRVAAAAVGHAWAGVEKLRASTAGARAVQRAGVVLGAVGVTVLPRDALHTRGSPRRQVSRCACTDAGGLHDGTGPELGHYQTLPPALPSVIKLTSVMRAQQFIP